jgi:hypothetical protein
VKEKPEEKRLVGLIWGLAIFDALIWCWNIYQIARIKK